MRNVFSPGKRPCFAVQMAMRRRCAPRRNFILDSLRSERCNRPLSVATLVHQEADRRVPQRRGSASDATPLLLPEESTIPAIAV